MDTMNRRRLLTTGALAGAVGISGCLDRIRDGSDEIPDNGSDEIPDNGSDEIPDECLLEPREEQGNGEPIEASATVDEIDDEDADCAIQAATVAIEQLDTELAVDLEDASWISSAYIRSADNGEFAAVRTYTNRSNGEVGTCPDPEWDFDEALTILPSEITLTLTNSTTDEHHECVYRIFLIQEVMSYD